MFNKNSLLEYIIAFSLFVFLEGQSMWEYSKSWLPFRSILEKLMTWKNSNIIIFIIRNRKFKIGLSKLWTLWIYSFLYLLNLPKGFVHFPHLTLYALKQPNSLCLETESECIVSVKAGHGVWCSNFWRELNSSYPHFEQQYTPVEVAINKFSL